MCRVYKILAIAIFFSFNGILFSQISEIEYHKWQYGCNFRTDSKIYVINSKEEFDSIGDCFLINYPFEKYSIIGYRGSTGGCIRPDIDFRILKDENNKKYQLILNIITNGACRINWPYGDILYTAKLDPAYAIEKIINGKVL